LGRDPSEGSEGRTLTKKRTNHPPKLAEWILRRIYPDKGEYTSVGDFREEYHEVYQSEGSFNSHLWYWKQIAKSVPSFIRNRIHWKIVMLKNYLKISLRNIKTHKVYSFINITGLAIGIACCILIILWVQDELNYDRFHKNADNTYMVPLTIHSSDGRTTTIQNSAGPLGNELKENFPEIKNYVRFTIFPSEFLVQYDDRKFREKNIYMVDSSFFEIFSFPLIRGNPQTALSNPYSIVITRRMAEKYFMNENPLGKTINLNNKYDFTVTGVLDDVPHNSSIKFNSLLPFSFCREFISDPTIWGHNYFTTYILAKNGINASELTKKIDLHLKEEKIGLPPSSRYSLFPLKKLHLYNLDGSEGGIKTVKIFILTALFILLIACINFTNLSSARGAKRAKEVGLRKTVGATRKNLIQQFLFESTILSLYSFFIAIIVSCLFLPILTQATDKEMHPQMLLNWPLLTLFLGIVIIVGFLAGFYPALFLSAFNVKEVLKGKLTGGTRHSKIRNGLVVFQFMISIALIFSTLVISDQLHYMVNKDLGFKKEHTIYIPMDEKIAGVYQAFKVEALKDPDVLNVTATSEVPSNYLISSSAFKWEGKDPGADNIFYVAAIDFDFVETLGIEMKSGRSYSLEYITDKTESILINEEAAHILGFKDPIGKKITWGNKGDFSIIGVAENYHFKSLDHPIEPLILPYYPRWFGYIFFRLHSSNVAKTIESLKKTHISFKTGYPFEFKFLDSEFNALYDSYQKQNLVFKYFSILAIIISCIGLFGLSSFALEQQTKEIGIRKVLGASIVGIITQLMSNFLKWVIIGNLIAWPIAYFAMNKWLQNFAYRIDISIWTFMLSTALAMSIALLTVSCQSVKAATANPVDSLRYE
jgi:ABC-type antimicrobial peptide transport system permease subunit